MNILSLTDNAKKKIDELSSGNTAVSLSIKGGGCAGFEYKWDVIDNNQIEAGSEVVEANTGKLVVDPTSIMFLVGTEIDYETAAFGQMFKIINPNAKAACGCGTSVDFDLEAMN
jgi:iron-sulfur cluster assembly accessory protein